jgi:predicted DNA-binding transcriptional regulator YafY
MQANRLFGIIYALLGKRSATARQLAERFGVSQRTIYRDIDVLSLAGVPVYTEKGKGGGICLLPDYVLDKSILSDEEQAEILSALHGLSAVKTAETDLVLRKLSDVFNKSAVNWLEVDFSDWSFENGAIFHGFKRAILGRLAVEFDYYSAYGEKTRRRAEPLQLWFKSRSWYARCFCLARQDVRLFKLTRVKKLAVTEECFPERDLLASPPPNGGSAERQRPDVTLRLKIASEMAHRVYDEFDDDRIERQPDGGYLVTVTWPEDDWVYGTILSYGEFIEVLEPGRIRESVRGKAEKIFGKHL